MTNFNNRIRIVAIALTVIMLFSMASINVFAENTHDVVNKTPEQNISEQILKEDKELVKDAEPISEKIDLTIADNLPELISIGEVEKNSHVKRLAEAEKDLNTVVFKNADGTNTSYIFSEPVKYADDNGVIRDKKSSLTESVDNVRYKEDYSYTNSDNDVKVYFPKDLGGDTGVILENDNISIELTPASLENSETKNLLSETAAQTAKPMKRQAEKSKAEVAVSKDVVDYNAVFGDNTTISYASTLNGFKEDIILNSYDGANEFVFNLKTNGLRLTCRDGLYYLANPETSEIVVNIGELIVYDNGGADLSVGYNHRYDVKTVVEDEEYLITVIVDEKFLLDEDTQYPVVVDPSFEVLSGANNIMDISVRENGSVIATSVNDGTGNHNTEKKDMRTFIKFPGLLNDPIFETLAPYGFGNGGPEVSSIKLMMYSRGTSATTGKVTAYAYNTASALNWNYNTSSFTTAQYNAAGDKWCETSVPQTTAGWVEFNITNAIHGQGDNGIVLRNQFEGSGNDPAYQSFASTRDPNNKPKIVVKWVGIVNDSFDKAIDITLNTPQKVQIPIGTKDKKYFSLTPSTSGFYTFESSGASNSDPTGTLYNSSEEKLLYNDDGADSKNFRITYLLSANKKYYLEVGVYDPQTCGSYSVTVSKSSNLSDLPSSAISLSSTKSANITTALQREYFSFTPERSGTYTITSSNNSGDPYGWLYNSSGTLLKENDDKESGNRNFSLTYSLTKGQKYFIVAGCYSTGVGSYNISMSVLTPAQPTNLTASNITGNSVRLDWTVASPHNAERWLIEYRTSSGSWQKSGDTWAKNYTVTGLSANTTYEFRVYSEAGSPEWTGIWSAPSNTATAKTLPEQPTNLTVSSITGNSVFLAWSNSPAHGADRWLIQYRTSGGSWQNVGDTWCKDYTVTGLAANTTYEFRVFGEAGSVEWQGTRSLASNTASAKTLPEQPSNLTVSTITGNSVFLAWSNSPAHGADRWLIQYRTSGGSWQNAGDTWCKDYTVTGLAANTTYEFRVFAEAGSVAWQGTRSLASNTASAKTLPEQPTNLTVSNITGNSVFLAWSNSPAHGADRWLIQYRTVGGSWQNAGDTWCKDYTVTGLTANTTYEFRVFAEAGSSPWKGTRSLASNTVSAKTQSVNQTVQQILNNIQNSGNIHSSKKTACKNVARELLNCGFETSFVAGVLGNLCYEGNTGIFEYYNTNTVYHPNLNIYLQSNYGYTYESEYSGQFIYNKNLTTVYNLFTALNNMNWKYNGADIGTGLGCIQWTFGRAYELVKIYREVAGNRDYITEEEALTAEGLMIARELNGDYKGVYTTWKNNNSSNINSESAAYNAGYIVCTEYEKPVDKKNKGVVRGNLAKLIYADMIK